MADLKKRSTKRRPWEAKREKQTGRTVDNYKLYNSQAWRKLSTAYRQKHPLCEPSEYKGATVEAAVVDHIIPVKDGGAVWNSANLMSMSHRIHNRKSGMEAHRGTLVKYIVLQSGEKVPADRNEIKKLLTNGLRL